MTIGDEFSSDEVTVYKDEGEAETATAGENFRLDKVELIKEAEQVSTKPSDSSHNVKEALLNEGATPTANKQTFTSTGSLFDATGAPSPSAAGLFSGSGPYAALLSATRLAGALSPVTLGLLAAASSSQNSASPGPLSADRVSALMRAGVTSPPTAQLAAAVASRSSPALAALQIAAALTPYSANRTSTGSTTPSAATPGVASSGEQFGAAIAAAGLQQLAAAAVAAAQSPPIWTSNSNSSAASNWLGAAGHNSGGIGAVPVTGGIASPAAAAALGACASPSSSLLARLSPAISTLSCLAAAANIPQPPAAHHNPASFLLNAQQHGAGDVPSPSSAASGVSYSASSVGGIENPQHQSVQSMATEVMLLKAAMLQQQQQQQQQQKFAAALDAAQLAVSSGNTASGLNVPVTPRSKQVTMPTPTSRRTANLDPNSSPLAALANSGSISGVKRSHHGLSLPGEQQPSPIVPLPLMGQNLQQQQHVGSPGQNLGSFAMDPRLQAHFGHQQYPGSAGHPHGHRHHHHHLSRGRSPPNSEPHVKKPLNAFMLFMKEQRAQVIAECTLKESAAINQILGQRWHNLSRDEQARYYDLAKAEKERHQQLYPNWSARENYACHSKKKRRKKTGGYPGATGQYGGMGPDGGKDPRDNALKKCRARYGIDQMDKWCKPCRRKKKCARYYNLPGADDDGDGAGLDSESVPSSHRNLGIPGVPGLKVECVPMSGAMPPTGGFGLPGGDDDYLSDSGSSMGGDSVDEDEDQLNAFHLVSESSSAASTPSPSPAVMAPLSPSSSINSSASHRQQPGSYVAAQHVGGGLPNTPISSSTISSIIPPMDAYHRQLQQQIPPGQVPLPQQQPPPQPQLFVNEGSDGISSATSLPSSTSGAANVASTDVQPPQPPLPSTPPSATSSQHLCSPTSSSSGLAFRPLLPAN